MLLELQGETGFQPVRKYTWGLDLAGLNGAGVAPANGRWSGDPSRDRQGAGLESAGGIGGLLAMRAPGAGRGGGDLNAVYTYDANGNVGQLVAWAAGFGGAQGDEWHLDRLLAHYEYDPYGGVTAQSGTYSAANPVRFSTKYWDDETGSPRRISPSADPGYWGYRYYSPSLGRWINRNPIGDFATANLAFGGLGGANVYAYVGNNPTNRTDYLGMMYIPCPPGEPCHDEGSSSSDPPSQEENDKKPCPGKPNLYQQSKPDSQAASQPTESDGWKKVKNIDDCRMGPPPGGNPGSCPDPSPGLLLCMAFKESSFDPTPGRGNVRGVGKMSEAACKEVDAAYKQPPGTCWNKVNSGDACAQQQMMDAYMRILLGRSKCDTDEALKRYGGWGKKPSEGKDRYVAPIRNCERCVQGILDGRPARDVPESELKSCFDTLTEESRDANRRWDRR